MREFLSHVHAEREKQGSKDIKDIGDNLSKYSHYYQNDGFEDLIYYEGPTAPLVGSSPQNNRKRRNFEKETSLEHIFELPIDDASENWFLVTNEELGKITVHGRQVTRDDLQTAHNANRLFNFILDVLMKNQSSFIYGESPSEVPIYAVVSMCGNEEEFPRNNGK